MTTDPSRGPSDPDHAPDTPDTVTTDAAAAPTLLEQMGGIPGLIFSTVPIVVFVTANAIGGLTPGIIAAVAVSVAIFAYRLIRRDPIQPAISGLFGVAICVFIAHRTGDAKGFFLVGIWTTLVYAGAFVLSIVVRWPLVGVIWNVVNGNGTAWRKHRRTLLAYDLATAVWAVLFGVRYLVQSFLYDSDQTGLLAAARIGMGWPLTIAAGLATVLLVRRAERVEATDPDAVTDTHETAADEMRETGGTTAPRD